MYKGFGSDYGVDACNPCWDGDGPWNWNDQTNIAASGGTCWSIGSLIVRPGCEAYLYTGYEYTGEVQVYGSGLHSNVKNNPLWTTCYDELIGCWPSMKCRCKMTPPVCDPVDGYQAVMQCDNSASQHTPMSCRYTKVVGTGYTDSWSESMSIDESISVSMKESLYGIFEEEIGISISTSFNWGTAGSEVFNEQTELEITINVDPGYILRIEQADGECGGNDVRTPLFKLTEIPPGRNAKPKVWYEMTFANGTTLSLDEASLAKFSKPTGTPMKVSPTFVDLYGKIDPDFAAKALSLEN